MNKDRTITTLTDREHILQKPEMYIGSVKETEISDYIEGKYKSFKIVPGLVKIINEIIDNSIDVHLKTPLNDTINIDVKITADTVKVSDTGRGIPVQKNEQNLYLPFVCWGFAKSGGNFTISENKGIGTFGVGSYCTNVNSTKFTAISDDGKKRYKVVFTNNASKYKESISDSTSRGCVVEFKPDLERFGLSEITAETIECIRQRILDLSQCFDNINFSFNGKKISKFTFKQYIKLFSNNFEIYENSNVKIGVIPSDCDDFRQYSYVNGIKTSDGGIHIDLISNNIVSIIRDKLSKKYKSIKPGDIKNKINLIVFLKDFSNPTFSSQTKEKLTNSMKEFNSFANIDYSFVNKILKNENFMNPIIEIYKIKQEFENRKALKAVEKVKKIKSDKYYKATGIAKYLFITEGESAYGGISKVLGNKNIGYYCLKGKPLNVYDVNASKFASNKELADLYQIIKNENYEKIVVASDLDIDGGHIVALVATFINKMLPEFKDKFARFNTPVKVVFKNKVPVKWTYDINENLKANKNETFRYLKGLGSLTKEIMETVLKVDTFDKMLVDLKFDSDSIINDFMSENESDTRKDYIRNRDFSIAKA